MEEIIEMMNAEQARQFCKGILRYIDGRDPEITDTAANMLFLMVKPHLSGNKQEKPKAKRFTPPTVEEVRAYCEERKNNVDPEQFVSYYSSNGWKVGKNSMKDWKAAVRTWEKAGYSKPKVSKTSTFLGGEHSSIDMRILEQDTISRYSRLHKG